MYVGVGFKQMFKFAHDFAQCSRLWSLDSLRPLLVVRVIYKQKPYKATVTTYCIQALLSTGLIVFFIGYIIVCIVHMRENSWVLKLQIWIWACFEKGYNNYTTTCNVQH